MKKTAAGLAALGRGDDKMLVHMTPREVGGLQALAMAHGGSLSINPKTGLPEAGFLKDILPTIAGIGLTMMGVPAWGVGLGTGLASKATGKSTQDALMSGLLAGGGAAMFGPSQGAVTQLGEQAGAQGWLAGQNSLDAAAAASSGVPDRIAELTAMPQQSYWDKLGGGMKAVAESPMQFLKDNKYGAGALGLGALGLMGGMDQPGLAGPQGGGGGSAGPMSKSWTRDYNPEAAGRTDMLYFNDTGYEGRYAVGGETYSVPQLEDGGFVLTKKAVDGLGGQGKVAAGLGAIPIRGPGARRGPKAGRDDKIKTTIDGKQPALVSHGESYVPKKKVQSLGGPKRLYALMKKAERRAA